MCHRDGGDQIPSTVSNLQSQTRCSNLILMSFPSSEIGAQSSRTHQPRQYVQKSLSSFSRVHMVSHCPAVGLRRIAWPAIELPKELQKYKSKTGQPFFLNHVTGRQRCSVPAKSMKKPKLSDVGRRAADVVVLFSSWWAFPFASELVFTAIFDQFTSVHDSHGMCSKSAL